MLFLLVFFCLGVSGSESPLPHASFAYFEGGSFEMGLKVSDRYARLHGEFPSRTERVATSFMLSRDPVTNADFEKFVKVSNYSRLRTSLKGYSYKFLSSVNQSVDHVVPSAKLDCEPWLIPVFRTDWQSDRNTSVYWKKLPVTHVDLDDALAYCRWLHPSARPPTEFEWEYAARNGTNDSAIYPWGDGFRRGRVNSWQGIFPTENQAIDGFARRNPVNSLPTQTTTGLHDMLGNVWEWTVSEYERPLAWKGGSGLQCQESRKHWDDSKRIYYSVRGASFIDTIDGSGTGYPVRISTRTGRVPHFTAENLGFRCLIPIKPSSKPSRPPRKILKREEQPPHPWQIMREEL
ncbi:Inactive C-alpha-formylglycine-proteinrating enzyme 2 [Cichlidogyrus casuarinus]|uniref:Inactive C-alpha-formylglycine-proteinrating enzyme 2 n=1 Tax=Cichlidogyrus casuarinus TaxID=1844966 RepID=A0ABD2PLL6_9PLAT